MKQAKKLCIFLNPVTNLFEQEKKTLLHIQKQYRRQQTTDLSEYNLHTAKQRVRHGLILHTYRISRSESLVFFFVLIVYNAADFVSVAWRSRSVPTCFTRMRRRNWAEYPFPPRETFFIILIPFNVGRE